MQKWLLWWLLFAIACDDLPSQSKPAHSAPTDFKSTTQSKPKVSHKNHPHGESTSPIFADGTPSEKITFALRHAAVIKYRSVGTTSSVMRANLQGEIDAAIKPKTPRHPRGHRAELAAYVIGKHLGLDNVAPVVWRPIPTVMLANIRKSRRNGRWFSLVSPEEPNLEAVAIYWLPDLSDHDWETPLGVREWSPWLKPDHAIPENSYALARDISNLLVFDFLIGNWDRFFVSDVSSAAL